METKPQKMSLTQTAAAYGKSAQTIRNWTEIEGRMPPFKRDGKQLYWDRADVEKHLSWIESTGALVFWDRIQHLPAIEREAA